MKVHIEGNLYLESDSMQFILKEYTGAISVDKNTGKETEVCNNVGYFTSVTSVFNHILKRKLKETDATTMKELLEAVKQIRENIDKQLEPLGA
jgi:hypothetical protein